MQKDVQLRLTPDKAFDDIALRKALGIDTQRPFIILRRSIDARRKDIMVDLICRIDPEEEIVSGMKLKDADPTRGQCIIVGSGPAGLFSALTLLEQGIKPIVLERGKDVHTRKIDIAKISTQGIVSSNSNYSFGEGGAGTYSDGKLYTRSKKRGENSKVLGTLVQFGAPKEILFEAHPHIGTDKLPKIIENMRNAIISHGGEVLFQHQVKTLIIKDGVCKGVIACDEQGGTEKKFDGPVILAIGNAARDTFQTLVKQGVSVDAKDLAMGVRLEHPQVLIDQIQYHSQDGRGRFLPPAEYSFTTQVDVDGRRVGVYSFCMCPGGFVVPAASGPCQVVVNGMSPSSRGSKWANSGMVVEFPATVTGFDQCSLTNPLRMMELQQRLELVTYQAANCSQRAPAQRMTDFLAQRTSQNVAPSSYAPGLTCADLRDVLPDFASRALRIALTTFARHAPGFLTPDATLIGTETRTSSPIRITRDPQMLQSISTPGLYPCGEGAGYAGGIVSAAVDGIRCALSLAQTFIPMC